MSHEQEKQGISVVIPVYRAAPTLPRLVSELKQTLTPLNRPYELILVNDCSPDQSGTVLDTLASENPELQPIHLRKNAGQHNALLCGIRHAKYPVIVTMDDDLQHPPREIPKLLEALTPEMDVVYGTPHNETRGWFRDLSSQITKLGLRFTLGVQIANYVSSFRVFRTDLRDAFKDFRSPFVAIDVLLSWGAQHYAQIPVEHHSRAEGTSNYSISKLIRHALNLITGFSVVPLQIASLLGLAAATFGLGSLIFVIARYFLFGVDVQGFTFLASSIAIFAGAQLLCLGIIGEYLARAYLRILESPQYVIKPTRNDDLRQ